MAIKTPDYAAEVAETALQALETQTGIQGRIARKELLFAGLHHADVTIELHLRDARFELIGEIKANVDRRAILAQAKQQLEVFNEPGIIIAPYLTQRMAEHCREIDLQFIDAAGNAYINQPGLYVFITGQKNTLAAKLGKPEYRAITRNALKITFALLCNRDLRNGTYREVARAAGVALGAVGTAYEGLVQRGFITGQKQRDALILPNPEKMIDDWVATYPVKLRRTLGARRFRVEDPQWWKHTELPPNAEWGGEVAADRLTQYLKPANQTIYLHNDHKNVLLKKLVGQYRLKHDPDGPVEILRAFWNFTPDNTPPTVVPPLLVYADLLATLQPRNIEVANLIRERYLKHETN